ncbi:MAG: RelA/SpoT family protein [Holosporales bacterium]|jgi:GTP pyrophosphokinase|nr:RelA/SpoT family protein [Holosporales bacterium]
MLRQFELVEKVAEYDPAIDENLLNKAYVFSMRAHGSQTRESGDPFFSHPVEVAGILANFRFDYVTIIAALLHDTVEDTVATLDDIKNAFGDKIADLVDGVTKISKLEFSSESTQQAENFRKLVLAMAQDIRVLFVKLADRQHNMRTLHYIKDPLRRKKIAKETLDIYAPLASRVGVQQIKEELEDLSFKEINKPAYETTHNRLKYLRASSAHPIEDIIDDLKKLLDKAGIQARIFGRIKTPYSIWKKMVSRNSTFEQLCDIIAFRVIVRTLPECYQSLGIFHNSFWVIPGRFKDYISTPKVNNYQSLHTTVMSPKHQRIEIQIRTEEMDLAAEYGIAAHWQYKQGGNAHDGKQYQLVCNLLQILEHTTNPEEFFENTKLEIYRDQVFCFTEKGEIFSFPKGVSVIDFAYAIDSWVGDHISGAKINGKPMPLKTVLQNGDQVEIITSSEQSPQSIWENFACTGKARTRIRQFIRSQQEQRMMQLGEKIIGEELQRTGINKEILNSRVFLSRFDCENINELYISIGEKIFSLEEVIACAQELAQTKQ